MTFKPTLAKNWCDQIRGGREIYLQPKLDGIRCIAQKDQSGDQVNLRSRSNKLITSMPHIAKALYPLMHDLEIWDGELYVPGWRFNKITSYVKRNDPLPDHEIVEYHVFDKYKEESLEYRLSYIAGSLKDHSGPIKQVVTVKDYYYDGLLDIWHDQWIKEGYEGVIIRFDTGRYERGRSSSLLKYKKFDDDEFTVVGYEEGKGKLKGCLGSFRLETRIGATFNAKPAEAEETLRQIWAIKNQWIGKKVVVQFQGYSQEGIPRFPVVKGIRWRHDT